MSVHPAGKRRILHLAADYPNAHMPRTVAVRNFVKANPWVDHTVIALTRTADPRRAEVVPGDGAGDRSVYSMRYWGFPLGVLLFPSMAIIALRIRRLLEVENIKVDLIHAHKFCFEGIVGFLLSRWIDVPLVCSIRAEAESKVLRFLPHYRPLFRKIVRRSKRLYYVSAFFRPRMEGLFPEAADRASLLPNFCPGTLPPLSVTPDPDRFVCILRLDIFKKKGLDRLLPAFAQFAAGHPQVSLDLVGPGTEKSICRVKKMIERHGLQGKVHLRGGMAHAELLEELPKYGGMCLPSHNETFGMAYVEALLSGVPILYSRQSGIDGFLDGIQGAVGVDPLSIPDISRGLEEIHVNHGQMHAALIQQHADIAARFDAGQYIERYNRDLGLVT